MKYIFLLVTGVFLLKSCIRCAESYDFNIPVSITPFNETYKLGDTLSIKMNLDHTRVFDISSGKEYDIPDINPLLNVLHSVIDEYPVIDAFSIENFICDSITYDFVLLYFSTLSNGVIFKEPNKTSTHTIIEFQLILQHTGLNSISFESPMGLFKRDLDFEGKCNNSSMEAFVTLNEESRNLNQHLVTEENQDVLDKYWASRDGSLYYSSFFFFKVE